MTNLQPKMLLASVFTVLLATGLLSPGSLAQPADGEANKPSTTKSPRVPGPAQDQNASKTSKQTSKEKPATSEDEAFIPSEEISEDFAVSFPVDI